MPEAPQEFASQFPEFPKLILQLLYNRNIKTQKEIDDFFEADYEQDLHDPFLHKGMREAVLRIKEAIDKKEKIVIYGDYDTDGISASVILHTLFKELGADFDVYIPDRNKGGYGLTALMVEELAKQKTNLIITVDCGVTNIKEVALARDLGVDIIITDHHLPKDELPPALAVINAKRKDDTYPFKWLCGGALAFKLTQAILYCESVGIEWEKAKNIKPGFEKWLLDLVALCTITDMVPLVGENRTLAKYGFLVLAQTKRMGLRELMRVSGLEPKLIKSAQGAELFSNIGSYEIGFVLGPRINAAGRMAHANTAFDLFITEDENEAQKIAKQLDKTNIDRQKLIEKIVAEIEKKITDEYGGNPPKVIFEGSEKWLTGVLGIVASRLVEKYSRPAFIYSKKGKESKGSSRSIKAFNLVEAMKNCKDALIDFGGHAMAAGFSIVNENIEKFGQCLLIQAERLTDDDLKPSLDIDAMIDFDGIDWPVYDWLKKFEPFGKENPKPLFLIKGASVKSVRWVGDGEKHMQIKLVQSSTCPTGSFRRELKVESSKELKGIAFRFDGFKDKIKAGDVADVVCEIDMNEWNGNRELQLIIKDVKLI